MMRFDKQRTYPNERRARDPTRGGWWVLVQGTAVARERSAELLFDLLFDLVESGPAGIDHGLVRYFRGCVAKRLAERFVLVRRREHDVTGLLAIVGRAGALDLFDFGERVRFLLAATRQGDRDQHSARVHQYSCSVHGALTDL